MMDALSFDLFIAELREHISKQIPNVLPLFEKHVTEARFARCWLEGKMRELPLGAQVLEVGAGTFILACYLQRAGYKVTALEPVTTEFSHFDQLGQAVIAYAVEHSIAPVVLRVCAEELEIIAQFHFAYSFHVMEHVGSVQTVLERVIRSLANGGEYNFTCPNYAFPYENHFHIPHLGSKKLTWLIMKRRIITSPMSSPPLAVWKSLNWITVAKVRNICRNHLKLTSRFSSDINWMYIRRTLDEPGFSKRHSRWLVSMIQLMERFKMLKAAMYIPVRFMPMMDCRITKAI